MIKKLRDFFEIYFLVNAIVDIKIVIESIELECEEEEEYVNERLKEELLGTLNYMLTDSYDSRELRLKIISILQSEFPDYHLKIQREIKKILEEEGNEDI